MICFLALIRANFGCLGAEVVDWTHETQDWREMTPGMFMQIKLIKKEKLGELKFWTCPQEEVWELPPAEEVETFEYEKGTSSPLSIVYEERSPTLTKLNLLCVFSTIHSLSPLRGEVVLPLHMYRWTNFVILELLAESSGVASPSLGTSGAKPSKQANKKGGEEEKKKLAHSHYIYNRILWDSKYKADEFVIGYLDRFVGTLFILCSISSTLNHSTFWIYSRTFRNSS